MAEGVPDLLLPGMVVGHRERHQLLQRHAVLGIDIEQLFRDGRELQPLLDAGRADEEPRRDLLLAQPLGAQRLEGAELVERMQRLALAVLGERVLLGQPIGAHHARHGLRLRHPLLLDQQFQRPEAAAAGRHLEHAGLFSFGVQHRADVQALQQRAVGNILRQRLDRDASLDAADVGLAQHQLVERNVAGCTQGNLLNSGRHVGILHDGRPRASLSTYNPSVRQAQPSNSLNRKENTELDA